MNIETYSENGEKFLKTVFKVHGKDVIISGKASNGKIYYEGYRRIDLGEYESYGAAEVSIEDYFNDIISIMHYIDQHALTSENLYNSLFVRIKYHIENYKRIAEEDLYTYIDLFIITQNCLSKSHRSFVYYSKEDGAKQFEQLKAICFKLFHNSLWVSVPDGNSAQCDHSFPLQRDHQKLTGKMEKKMYRVFG